MSKLIVSTVVNQAVGAPLLSFGGWGSLLYSEHLGGYQDPSNVHGYTYNPADGGWYLSPPAPDYGQYSWLNPADQNLSTQLDFYRDLRIQHNNIEGLSGPEPSWWQEIVDLYRRTFLEERKVDGEVNEDYQRSLDFVPRVDPLALDLDGDGIETVSANTGIVFDFDGDGLKTGTGWIKGDDGFLVRDLDDK